MFFNAALPRSKQRQATGFPFRPKKNKDPPRNAEADASKSCIILECSCLVAAKKQPSSGGQVLL